MWPSIPLPPLCRPSSPSLKASSSSPLQRLSFSHVSVTLLRTTTRKTLNVEIDQLEIQFNQSSCNFFITTTQKHQFVESNDTQRRRLEEESNDVYASGFNKDDGGWSQRGGGGGGPIMHT
ncbi:hypothetical protein MTR_5g016620 [Medicago truncatula]|uniref:Uncharacterized protein n=1 Tax=Medicago truncatula TaxID=3880 RepID=G7K598_MEDTR|nr:hypothetical protein MTR_5g016620 [Medicago truncatula]